MFDPVEGQVQMLQAGQVLQSLNPPTNKNSLGITAALHNSCVKHTNKSQLTVCVSLDVVVGQLQISQLRQTVQSLHPLNHVVVQVQNLETLTAMKVLYELKHTQSLIQLAPTGTAAPVKAMQ